jgi:modulator of FtsH protease
MIFCVSYSIKKLNIINGAYDSPISEAASLYLDFLNLFVSLLQILGIFGGSKEE